MGHWKGADFMQTDDLVLQKFLETLRKPAIRMLKKAIDEASQSEERVYVKKATACRILDCDNKTFNEHFAGQIDVYYLGDSKMKRYLRSDVERLANKVKA